MVEQEDSHLSESPSKTPLDHQDEDTYTTDVMGWLLLMSAETKKS